MLAVMESRLGLFDNDAHSQLVDEVTRLRAAGASVEVGDTQDEAYLDPDEIRAVFHELRALDTRLGEIAAPRRARMPTPAGRAGALRRHDALREPYRVEWLFGPHATDALPWHHQRGRAAALLTITSAHELSDETAARRYRTMSGPLDSRVLQHIFDHEVAHVGGLDLAAAVAVVEQTMLGRGTSSAHRTAVKRVTQLSEFVEGGVNARFRRIVRYCTDSLGIRSRKELVARRIRAALDATHAARPLMMSFGCGTALPMLEVLAEEVRRTPGRAPKLILLDQDPLALAAATTLAEDMGLRAYIEVHCRRLFDRWGRPTDLSSVLRGRQLHIAEDSGLREYLPDRIYRWLTADTWRVLAPGGLMSTGNMNASRPQREFLHGMMGWRPNVHMRSIADGLNLHARAGVPRANTNAVVTPEGVYSLFFSVKDPGLSR